MSSEAIKHFLSRRKRHDSSECPICYEDKELYIFDCADVEHCYCLDCYKKIDKCSSCKIPKSQYNIDLFQEPRIYEEKEIPRSRQVRNRLTIDEFNRIISTGTCVCSFVLLKGPNQGTICGIIVNKFHASQQFNKQKCMLHIPFKY